MPPPPPTTLVLEEFLESVLPLTVSVPMLAMPPPSAALPSAMVKPESVAVTLLLTRNTPKLSLPLMVTPALGPVIVIGATVAEPPSVSVPLVSVMVCDEANTPGSKVIGRAVVVVSASASAMA